MPEVRVQLSDEQVERLRKLDPGDYVTGSPGLLLINAVREQLPPPIKVGDKVQRRVAVSDTAPVAEVRFIEEGQAWVRFDDGERCTYFVRDLVRVEEGE